MSFHTSLTCTHYYPCRNQSYECCSFTILSLIGTTIWNFALIYLGKLLSGSWDVLMNGLHTILYYVCHYYFSGDL